MVQIPKALVIGGGIGGNALALQLARSGTKVDLVESDPNWRVYGAGLTMTGPTLRAFRTLGMLPDIRKHGFLSDGLKLFNAGGSLISVLPQHMDEADIPHSGGIMRPVLHRLLCDRVREAGVGVRLGVTATSLDPETTQVAVSFSDGSRSRYDLVVGADGCFSSTRKLLFPDAPEPRYTGQVCWRIVAPRPAEMTSVEFYLGRIKVGLVPCSPTEMYMFVLENEPRKQRKREEDLIPELKQLISGFGGRIAQVREGIGPQSNIIYRPLEALLLPRPWHVGAIILIGDAVHATTPHLASGAGIAVEDAIVLVEELHRAASVEAGMTAFEARRFERCRLVVENSVRLGQMEIDGADPKAHGALMDESAQLLAAAI